MYSVFEKQLFYRYLSVPKKYKEGSYTGKHNCSTHYKVFNGNYFTGLSHVNLFQIFTEYILYGKLIEACITVLTSKKILV